MACLLFVAARVSHLVCLDTSPLTVTPLQVWAPKQPALANLQQHGNLLPLRTQLLFSSVAALLGSPGQANYSAANAALDAAARHAQQVGAAIVSMQWGAWAGGGMAAHEASTAARLERLGLGLIGIGAGLQALEAAVSGISPCAVLAAVPFRWHQFVAAARKPLPHLFAAYGPAAAAAEEEEVHSSLQQTAAIDTAEVEAAVHAAVHGILGMGVSVDAPLMAAGLDSLGAVELRSSLEARLGLQLPSTLVFDYPTVASLTEFLTGRLGQAAPSAPADLAVLRRASLAAVAPAAAAVVMLGAAARSPGQALGQLAAASQGIDAVGLVPLERWDVEAEPLAARFGAYLPNIAAFDAAAFGVSDAEAALMDPQQRLLLESVGEALLAAPADAAPMRARGIYVGGCSLCVSLLAASGHVGTCCAASSHLPYPRCSRRHRILRLRQPGGAAR